MNNGKLYKTKLINKTKNNKRYKMPAKKANKKSSKPKESTSGNLIEYYGTECYYCIKMAPDVEKLEKELKVKIKKVEVWHNAKNQAEFVKISSGKCGGVPFFYNTKSGKFICGAGSYENLKAWALSK